MQASQNLSKLIDRWPSAFVARSEVGKFTGGMIQPGTLANLDSKGLGPEKIRVSRKVAYPVIPFVRWLETRSLVDAAGPMAAARKKKRNQCGAA
jgi:hypothetical protein